MSGRTGTIVPLACQEPLVATIDLNAIPDDADTAAVDGYVVSLPDC